MVILLCAIASPAIPPAPAIPIKTPLAVLSAVLRVIIISPETHLR
jgi:hypothetical protein